MVPPGYNPVASLIEKPIAARREAEWLEVHEAALLLESARTYRPERATFAQPHMYPIVAVGAIQNVIGRLRALDQAHVAIAKPVGVRVGVPDRVGVDQ